MLKTRVIPIFFLMDGRLVQSRNFTEHRIIGDPIQELERVHGWDADEIVYLDISRRPYPGMRDILAAVSERLFCPLAFGGHVRTVDDAEYMIRNGAEKVVINTAALENPPLITEIARKFGSQAVTIAIDYRGDAVFSDRGTKRHDKTPLEWAKEVESLGAGEVIISSIERDGLGQGYDLQTIQKTSSALGIPVIASAGVGSPRNLLEGIGVGASAVAAGNFFHFTENAYPRAKKYLKDRGMNVRLEDRAGVSGP